MNRVPLNITAQTQLEKQNLTRIQIIKKITIDHKNYVSVFLNSVCWKRDVYSFVRIEPYGVLWFIKSVPLQIRKLLKFSDI